MFTSSLHSYQIKKSKCTRATHRDLDGHPLVDAVLVIEVDAVNAEPLEAALARCPHESWVAADLPFPIGEGDAELGGQLNLLPHPTLKRLLRMNSEALHQAFSGCV